MKIRKEQGRLLHTRRGFMKATLLALCCGWVTKKTSHAAGVSGHEGLKALVGEHLIYRAKCPLLGEVATGEVRFQRVKGTLKYLAALETRLQGALGIITLQRSDLFASLMEWSPRKARLLPLWHADQVFNKGGWKRKVLTFEDDRSGYTEYRLYPDPRRGGVRRWTAGGRTLDDPLSAFYNWRISAFGELRPGRNYVVDNLARKDPLALRFWTASEEEAKGRLAKEPERNGKVHYLRAHLDVELQEAVSGDIEAWLDEEWVPVEGRANRVRVVGEATFYLVRKARLPEPELSVAPVPPLARDLWRLA